MLVVNLTTNFSSPLKITPCMSHPYSVTKSVDVHLINGKRMVEDMTDRTFINGQQWLKTCMIEKVTRKKI